MDARPEACGHRSQALDIKQRNWNFQQNLDRQSIHADNARVDREAGFRTKKPRAFGQSSRVLKRFALPSPFETPSFAWLLRVRECR